MKYFKKGKASGKSSSFLYPITAAKPNVFFVKEKKNILFVRSKSFVSMLKIHLCGRWQLVNKRTFDSSGCFGRATLYPTWPALLSITWLKMQPSAKATWQHRLLQLQLLSSQLLLLLLLLLTGISVSFRFVTRHTHTPTRAHVQHTPTRTHTLARTMCSHWAQMCQIMTCRRVQFIW